MLPLLLLRFKLYDIGMNILRSVFWFVLIGCLCSIAVLAKVAVVHPWAWVLVLSQVLGAYFMAEIVHTTHKKFKAPEPTSLAFQKELSKYKV